MIDEPDISVRLLQTMFAGPVIVSVLFALTLRLPYVRLLVGIVWLVVTVSDPNDVYVGTTIAGKSTAAEPELVEPVTNALPSTVVVWDGPAVEAPQTFA